MQSEYGITQNRDSQLRAEVFIADTRQDKNKLNCCRRRWNNRGILNIRRQKMLFAGAEIEFFFAAQKRHPYASVTEPSMLKWSNCLSCLLLASLARQ